MKRGEVWWANFPAPAGRRPALLLSRDRAYEVRTRVTVAPLTTRLRDIESHVEVGPEDGLPRVSAVNLDEVMTIPKGLLDERISTLGRTRIRAVNRALRFALEID